MTNLPERIGNYQLERQIGKGGMSEVWLARHRSLDDRQVAVKLLLSQDPEWIERFTREANITSRLHHECIVQIYDHGYQHPYHYTVMEYIQGGALRELLKQKGALPIEQALHILRCIGAALDYAHAHGVIHRDVSPGNILLERDNKRVLLTDFGIARVAGKVGMTTINKMMGTPGYLSPEHASSATAVTHLSDIYSLGIVLFEMLSGALPWNHNPGMVDSSGGPFTAPLPLRSRGVTGLPAEMDRIIQTMLALDPAKRYPNAQAAIEDLDRVLARHTTPTQVVGPVEQSAAASGTGQVAIQVQSAELHPVEKVLGPDLLKGPMQEARNRAASLGDPREVAALLDRWSAAGRFRRKLLGRQASFHRIASSNVYFYTLRVLYETRDPVTMVEEPDHKAQPVRLEKEQDRWDVELPAPQGFVDEPGGTVRLPGSTRVIACEVCAGIGRITCPRCQGRQRIIREPSASPPARTGRPVAPAEAAVATASPRASQPAVIPCPECNGAGGIPCARCDRVGRLVQQKTIRWRRRASTLEAHDDLPRVDEEWLRRVCEAKEVYRETEKSGFRPEWKLVPQLAGLIDEATAALDSDTRVALSEVTIAFIPVTEIVFDLGEAPAKPPEASANGAPAPPDTGLYRWHIYGFERHLPKDWRFLNWDRVNVILLALASTILLALLALLLLRG